MTALSYNRSRERKVVFNDVESTKPLPKVTPTPVTAPKVSNASQASAAADARLEQTSQMDTLQKPQKRKKWAFSRNTLKNLVFLFVVGVALLLIWS